MNLSAKIEAILFFKNEPVSIKRLVDILQVPAEEVVQAINILKEKLNNRGVTLLQNGEEIMLGTSPELSSMIEDLQKEEINKDLSKAALETLSIILYKDGASRGDIDYIRGVNSSFTLRALSIRGLIEKTTDAKDNRRYIYKPSFGLLSFMGVKNIEELPDYTEIKRSIDSSVAPDEGATSNQDL